MNKISSILLTLIALLPFWALYIVADLLYVILYHIIGYRVRVVATNLQNSFPEKTAAERKQIAKKYYRFLADLIVETIKMKTISKAEICKRMQVINPEEILNYIHHGQSVLIVSGHYGNWEWGTPRLAIMCDAPSLVIYKPLSNQSFERTFNAMRTRFGGLMVSMKDTLRKFVEYKNQVHTSIFLVDQTPTRQGSDYFIDFLNQPTLVFKGIEKIAQRTQHPVVYCHIDRVKRGHYQVKFTTLVTHPQEMEENKITLLHNHFLEEIIKEKPELWLWSHKRWKHKPRHD